MQVIQPITITDTILDSSNVPETDYAEWDVAATYAIAARVIMVSTHRVYESVIGSNLGNAPNTDDGTNWLDVSATNRWKAFDEIISDQVIQVGTATIEYEVISDPPLVSDFLPIVYQSVAVFGLEAGWVQVIVTSDADGEVYNETVSLDDHAGINNWYDYHFAAIENLTDALFVGLPQYIDATVKVVIGGGVSPGGGAPIITKVGQIVFGTARAIGGTVFGTNIEFLDFSTKEKNIYGDSVIVEREFSKRITYDVSIPTTAIRATYNFLSGYRARALVWIGDERTDLGLFSYGYFKDFSILLSGPNISMVTIQTEGLT